MKYNGTTNSQSTEGKVTAPAPERVQDLAEACVRFVERSLGVRLDYEAETLSLLDHYIEEGRRAAREKPETMMLLAHTAGAYFGEVVRRRYPSWWRAEDDDPTSWRLELEPVFLSFSPVQLIADALLRDEEAPEADATVGAGLDLDEQDRDVVAARLAELPPVSEREFYAPSTRLEVLDIAVDAIRARRVAEGDEADAALTPEDYEP